MTKFVPKFNLVNSTKVHPSELEPEKNHSVVKGFVGFYEFDRVNLLISLLLHDALVLSLELADEILV